MISLPIDIQVLILPLLTSTSLISLSQTNRHFRQLIDPRRKHFVNRLLELECLPEYGGEVTINEHAKIIVPPGRVSYTCTRCLKIIPHTRFDNHALLRLRFRKPPPESRVGQQLCGWMSGDAKAQGLKRQADLRNDTLENFITWMIESFSPEMSSETYTELYKIGSTRHRRTCNECKFLTGFWGRNAGVENQGWRGKYRNSNIGTAAVPVVKGRQRRCHDSTERYFCGLFPLADDSEYPWRRKIYREDNCDWWTLWSIRCPGCGTWQERADFRKGSGYGVKSTPADPDEWRQPGWDGPHFEEWRCNWCFVKKAGEEELGKELLAWWKRLVDFEIESFKTLLPVGWHAVGLIEHATAKKWSWAEIVKQDGASEGLWRVPTTGEIGKMDAENRRHYYRILKRWMDSLDDPESVLGDVMDRHWFRPWWKGYEVLERRIVELETFTELLEADPQQLVRFAMDGYAPLV